MTRLFKLIQVSIVALWLMAFSLPALAIENPRPTYTWAKPANHITFNAITDNPQVGDERRFLWTRGLADADFSYPLQVTDGEEVVLQVYYDNNAAPNYNLKAKNTRVQFVLPAKTDSSQTVDAFISADNAKPGTVNSVVAITAAQPFNLVYEQGSAKIWNNKLHGANVDDQVVTPQGALIGYDKLDGVVPGGGQYSGYVTIKAKVQFAKTTASTGATGVVNTGPGQTLALFVVATFIGAFAHRLYNSRRV